MENTSLERLVNEDYLYAKVLQYFGVAFYEARNKTLKEVCEAHQINQAQLKDLVKASKQMHRTSEDTSLHTLSTSAIIDYLKHAHQVFIKDRLPYLLYQVTLLPDLLPHGLIHDLKIVLPLFVEDFAHHMYQEEHILFAYITQLEAFVNEEIPTSHITDKINQFSIQEFALHHTNSDHEMTGIRGITNQYQIENLDDIQQKVLYHALAAFDNELTAHAQIENNILFPKAICLEEQVLSKLNTQIVSN